DRSDMSDVDDIREYLGISDDSAEWRAIEAVGPEHVALVAELVRLLREVRAILTGTPHRSHPSSWLHAGKVRTYGRFNTPLEVFTDPKLTQHWIDELND
ncbi:MAG TPA: hypothetical protein VEX37_13070, partial [Thermomicrobiales bacterium]|nr:hypothetical protein [Thermomicrobiales bacterium]